MNKNFEKDLRSGAIGERVAWDILQNEKDTRNIHDVRQDPKFQGFDVDFLWEKSNRYIWWVEVKTDLQMAKTGNIVYECSTSGNIGCFEKTKAEVIMYFDAESNIMYAIYVPKLRNYVEKTNLKKIRMGDNAEGYLIKVADLIENKVIIKQWDKY